jgi:hypothetical protein
MISAKIRQFDTRDGFELVDFSEVGLPVFRLTVEAVTLQKTSMPTIEEFSLRAIEIGESDAEGISRLLGLSDVIVRDSLDTLAYDELVARPEDDPGSPDGHYLVTDLGKELLAQGTRVYRDETLVFDYDGLRRRPIRLGKESLLRAAELSEMQAFQIRPYPVDPPSIEDIALNEVVPAVRRISDRPFERTLLAIRRIVRRQTLFRPAIGLVYRGLDSNDYQVGFAIGDTLSQEHEIVFSRHGGAKKPGFIRVQSSMDAMAAISDRLGEPLWNSLADLQTVGQLQRGITAALDEYSVLRAKTGRLKRRPKSEDQNQQDPARIEGRVIELRHKLNSLGLRRASPYELKELLNEALDNAERRLLITSRTVDAKAAPAHLIKKITDRLAEGVNIRIETSVELNVNPKGKAGAFEPAVQLWLEAQQRVGFTLAHRPNDELFFLIKDDDLAIISNRPFLNEARQKCFTPCAAVVTRLPLQVREMASVAGLKDVSPVFLRKKK